MTRLNYYVLENDAVAKLLFGQLLDNHDEYEIINKKQEQFARANRVLQAISMGCMSWREAMVAR